MSLFCRKTNIGFYVRMYGRVVTFIIKSVDFCFYGSDHIYVQCLRMFVFCQRMNKHSIDVDKCIESHISLICAFIFAHSHFVNKFDFQYYFFSLQPFANYIYQQYASRRHITYATKHILPVCLYVCVFVSLSTIFFSKSERKDFERSTLNTQTEKSYLHNIVIKCD